MKDISILFLGKFDDPFSLKALSFCHQNSKNVTSCLGQWGDPFPAEAKNWEGDLIVSYLSRWIIPEFLIQKAQFAAINFHPAPPDYPGIGCNNFALYDEVDVYGVTCHHMAAKVDTGAIIKVARFPVFPTDTVESLIDRTYINQSALFYEVVGALLKGASLPTSDEKWSSKPHTRVELNELSTISPSMSGDEIARRVRATSYKNWQPSITLHSFTFKYRPDNSNS